MFKFETFCTILEGIDPQLPALAWADAGTRAPNDSNQAGQRGAISYGKLLKICLNVDLHLESIGCPRSSVVAVVASHSLETAALLIALPRSGRVCHPLNPQMTSKKAIEFALRDVNAKLLVVSATWLAEVSTSHQIPFNRPRVKYVDDSNL